MAKLSYKVFIWHNFIQNSGPYRFDYNSDNESWVGRDEQWILDLLSQELTEKLDTTVKLIYEADYL